jgi:MFS family permease
MANVQDRADSASLHASVGREPDIGRAAWLALAAALLGWMFDGAEQAVFAMVGRQAIIDLLATQNESVIGLWFGVVTAVFLVGAATGGVVFGWLGDRIGRVRAMTLSVLTYALFTGLCGVAITPLQIGIFRFIAALGMGGEWSLGVALVMEVWPNRSRALMAGLIGAAANVGYLLVGFVGLGLVAVLADMHGWLTAIGLSDAWASALVANRGWRLMMILGTAPAFLGGGTRRNFPLADARPAGRGAGSDRPDPNHLPLGLAGTGVAGAHDECARHRFAVGPGDCPGWLHLSARAVLAAPSEDERRDRREPFLAVHGAADAVGRLPGGRGAVGHVGIGPMGFRVRR